MKSLLFSVLLLAVATLAIAQSDTTRILPAPEKTLDSDDFYKVILIGFMPGKKDEFSEESNLRGLNLINFSLGYQFHQYLNLGATVAWDVYDMSMFSFRADFRGTLNKKKVSPYYSLQAGYGFPADLGDNWNDRIDLKGGPLLHPALGLRFATNKKASFLLEAGYLFQHAERNNEERKRYDDILYRRLNIRFGISF